MEATKSLACPRNNSNPLAGQGVFIPIWLDALGLTPQEFRLYCHIARRGRCFASRELMMTWTGLSRRQFYKALRGLLERGIVAREERHGKTTVYTAQQPDPEQENPDPYPQRDGYARECATRTHSGTHPYPQRARDPYPQRNPKSIPKSTNKEEAVLPGSSAYLEWKIDLFGKHKIEKEKTCDLESITA